MSVKFHECFQITKLVKSLHSEFLVKAHEAMEKTEKLGKVVNKLGIWEKMASGLAIITCFEWSVDPRVLISNLRAITEVTISSC